MLSPLLMGCLVGWAVVLPAATAWADEPLQVWIGDLEKDPSLIGKLIAVEGRFSARLGQSRIVLKNCNVHFYISDKARPQQYGRLRCVRLVGTMRKLGTKLIMHVTELYSLDDDATRFHRAAARIGAGEYRRWYELSERAERVGRYYNDSELLELAQEAQAKGLLAEEQSLAPGQHAALLALADRAEQAKLPTAELRRMRHKALCWQLQELRRQKAAADQWQQLAHRVRTLLPAAAQANKDAPQELLKKYRSDPLRTYRSSSEQRDALDRELWIAAASEQLLAAAAAPNADLLKLADQAAATIPERPELYRQLVQEFVDRESAAIAGLPADQVAGQRVRVLAGVLRQRLGQPQQAAKLLRTWLDGRRAKLSRRDAEGRYLLARDYLADLSERQTAVSLLMEALEIEPQYGKAAEQLEALGYVKTSRGWRHRDEPAAGPSAAVGLTGKLPQPGMTPDQVRKLLGPPQPQHVLRLGTAAQILEQWVYKGPPDVYVTFALERGSAPKVVSVKSFSKPSPR